MARNNDRSRGSKRAPAAASLRPRRGKPKVCIFCRDSIPWVDYKDANLLGRFLSERAKIKARRTTGNCNRHQREVAVAIKTARELALLPYAKRTVAERLGGRGGRGGRGGPGGGPGRPREEQSEAPAGVEEAVAEAADTTVDTTADTTAPDIEDLDIGAEDVGGDDDEE
jgi:small subunit ribosomal protein S18